MALLLCLRGALINFVLAIVRVLDTWASSGKEKSVIIEMTGKSDRGSFQGQGRGTNSKISRGRGRSICREHLREHLIDTSSRTTSMCLNDQSPFERASSARTIFERAPSERAPSKRALFEGTPSERLEREPSKRDAFERVASERASSKRLFEGTI